MLRPNKAEKLEQGSPLEIHFSMALSLLCLRGDWRQEMLARLYYDVFQCPLTAKSSLALPVSLSPQPGTRILQYEAQ